MNLARDRPENEEDIMAMPLSSDEEAEGEQEGSVKLDKPNSHSTGIKRKKEDDGVTISPRALKKVKMESKPTRSSKRTAKQHTEVAARLPEPQDVSILQTDNSIVVPEFPDFLSQSSQSRKRPKAKFGKSNSYTVRPPSSSQEVPTTTTFNDPGEVPSTPRKSTQVVSTFKDLDTPAPPSSRRRDSRQRRHSAVKVPSSSASISEEPTLSFQMPEELGQPQSSSASTNLSPVFDFGESPKEVLRVARTRSHSSSSSSSALSSIDSIASHELTETQKNDLSNDTHSQDPLLPGQVRCPLCRKAIRPAPTWSSVTPTDPSKLTLRKQQLFCHAHRIADAHAFWDDQGYPDIDWSRLENVIIPKHIAHLRRIIYRKIPSYYLDNLDAQIRTLRKNKAKIRRYLDTDVVEVVKPGYYGPRGAKIMGNAITTSMSIHLRKCLDGDETVRLVGAAGYVSAVLLPELLLRIVMHDMKLSSGEAEEAEAKARKIISISTEAGMLLWPDDDHVVAEDED